MLDGLINAHAKMHILPRIYVLVFIVVRKSVMIRRFQLEGS